MSSPAEEKKNELLGAIDDLGLQLRRTRKDSEGLRNEVEKLRKDNEELRSDGRQGVGGRGRRKRLSFVRPLR